MSPALSHHNAPTWVCDQTCDRTVTQQTHIIFYLIYYTSLLSFIQILKLSQILRCIYFSREPKYIPVLRFSCLDQCFQNWIKVPTASEFSVVSCYTYGFLALISGYRVRSLVVVCETSEWRFFLSLSWRFPNILKKNSDNNSMTLCVPISALIIINFLSILFHLSLYPYHTHAYFLGILVAN